jgi:hypothetical protein
MMTTNSQRILIGRDRILESTKIAPVMHIVAIPDAAASKMERRVQLRQSG